MSEDTLRGRVREILERANAGMGPHGTRLELLSLEGGVARLRVQRTGEPHGCCECDVLLPVALNYLLQDLRGLEGLRGVELA